MSITTLLTDVGLTNAIEINPTPAIAAYSTSMGFRVKISSDNNGPTTINVNGKGAVPVVTAAGVPLKGGELKAGQIHSVHYTGTAFQLAHEPLSYMTSNTMYVDSGNRLWSKAIHPTLIPGVDESYLWMNNKYPTIAFQANSARSIRL